MARVAVAVALGGGSCAVVKTRKRHWLLWLAFYLRRRYGPREPVRLGWYASEDDETYTMGPLESFEALVAQATREGMGFDGAGSKGCHRFYVMEAAQRPIRLADYLDVDLVLERACEAAEDDVGGGDGCMFDDGCGSDAQVRELGLAIRRVVDRWQRKHDLVFKPWQFTHVGYRNSYTYFRDFRPLGEI